MGYRYSRKRYRSDTKAAEAIVGLFFLLPLMAIFNKPKRKKKREKTLQKTIDEHFE